MKNYKFTITQNNQQQQGPVVDPDAIVKLQKALQEFFENIPDATLSIQISDKI